MSAPTRLVLPAVLSEQERLAAWNPDLRARGSELDWSAVASVSPEALRVLLAQVDEAADELCLA